MSAQPKRTQYIRYHKTLIHFDGVQLFIAIGPRKRKYICLAVPQDDAEDSFLCTPITEEAFQEYMYQRIDLYALIVFSYGKHYLINLNEEVSNKGLPLYEISNIPTEWLPERQVFSRCHTEEYVLEETNNIPKIQVSNQKIAIDGRWDATDLSELPDLYRDNYSFIYALEVRDQRTTHRTSELFRKYPWRGGFSTVSFYQSLYQELPRPHRLSIVGMEYNSPGTITISAANTVIEQVHQMAKAFNTDRKGLRNLYRELYDGMSLRELLGRSLDEIDPDLLDVEFVKTAAIALSNKMGFQKLDQLLSLTENNWIACAKILLSYFRRVRALADFLSSGKAVV